MDIEFVDIKTDMPVQRQDLYSVCSNGDVHYRDLHDGWDLDYSTTARIKQEEKAMDTIKEIVEQDVKDANEDDYTSYLDDLAQNGCVSGMVGHLISYHDICKFYEDHKTEIGCLLSDALDLIGLPINDVFGDRWDNSDPLANDTNNQNLLAWFAYEETARQLQA